MRPGFTGGSKGPALRSASAVGGSHVGGTVARWLAAAAVVVAAAGTGIYYRTAQIERARAERAAGEAAGRQVVLALQIAGSKLQLVQTKISPGCSSSRITNRIKGVIYENCSLRFHVVGRGDDGSGRAGRDDSRQRRAAGRKSG